MTFASARATSKLINGLTAKFTKDTDKDAVPSLRRRSRSGAPHRTGAPVRSDSLEEGTFEDTFFAVPAKGEPDRQLKAARKLRDKARALCRQRREGKDLSANERKVARMTDTAVRLYEEFCMIARVSAGRIFPSYDHLVEKTELSRMSVSRGLRILEELGLIIRQRRFKRVETEGSGWQWAQTSNVYRLTLSKWLLSFLPRSMQAAPTPDDAIQREADRQEEIQHMHATLNCRELARATVGSGPLADVLARLGSSLDARYASNSLILNR